MHIRSAKPVHRWREFLGGVGIIVLGILIAIGLEQAWVDWSAIPARTRHGWSSEVANRGASATLIPHPAAGAAL